MAELVNGTYAVISVASSLALDVRADSSSLVTLATPDFEDEQIWNVIKKNSVYLDDVNYKPAWVIKSAVTGKIVSPAGYANVAGTTVGQENYDPDSYNYEAETEEEAITDDPSFYPTWVIEDTGGTATFRNDTYSTYTIRRPTVSSDTGYGTIGVSMAASGSSVGVANYSNVNAQKWIFVPVSLLFEDGLYTIRSAGDTKLGLTVESKSTANAAKVILDSISDATNQQFKVSQFGDYYRFIAAHSSKAVDIKGNTPSKGANIIQYTVNQSDYASSVKATKYTTLKLLYTLSSTNTEFKVSIIKLEMSSSRKKGLTEKSTIAAKYTSMTSGSFSNARKSGPAANTSQSKNVNKATKSSSLSLSKFNFVFNRQNSNVSGKINMSVSIKGTASGSTTYAKNIGISVTIPAKNSGNIDVTDDSQLWLIEDADFIDQGNTIYQSCKITPKSNHNFALDASGGVKSKASLILWTPNDKAANQKWVFVRTVMDGTDLDAPGKIRETSFSITGSGAISVSGLTFTSRYNAFIARYKVRTYTSGDGKYSDSSWMNVADDSTVNSGWGEAGKPTFEYTPINNIIRLPYSHSHTLDSSAKSIDLIFEIRAFVNNYGNDSYPAQGPVTQSTVHLSQKPVISMRSSAIYADPSTNDIGIVTNMSDTLDEGCQLLRGRLLDSTGAPISDWISRSSMQLIHTANASLYRFPRNGETVQFEYSMLCMNGTFVSGKINKLYEFNSGNPISMTYLDDDSCTAIVSVPTATYGFCLVSVPDIDINRLYVAERVSATGAMAWRIAPPLNRDFDVYVFTSSDNVTWLYSSTTGRINSHLFIWNWTSDGSTESLDSFASIIVNVDDPPQQTRSYTSGISFSKPMSRRYPVGFADITIESDLSIEGTAVDTDANYYSANPIPSHTTTEYLMSLVSLSGKGIHPIYRTPYGDWYTVGIEGVNLTKKSIGYSSASITQRAIKD